jgi:hypothetical protein
MKSYWESEGGGVVVVVVVVVAAAAAAAAAACCEKSTMWMFTYLKTGHNLLMFTCLCIKNPFQCYSCRAVNTNVRSKCIVDILDVFSKNLVCHIQFLSIARMREHVDMQFL